VRVSEAVLALPLAFVAGGVILNVLKEELPAERESRFWAFSLGVAIYAALLVAM
jgi:zinc transporter ZupT